jgi:pilus assembly protein Flp/PilA
MNKFFISLYLLAHTVPDRLKRDDRGATAVEYGLLVGLIAAVIITLVVTLGGQIAGLFEGVTTEIPGAPAAPAAG